MAGILTIGEALGVLRSVSTLDVNGTLAVGTGGAEANVAIGLARLGVRAIFAGRVGDDGLGRRIVRTLAEEGVQTAVVTDATAPTGLLIKEQPSSGRTSVTYHRHDSAGSRIDESDAAAMPFDEIALVHVTGITPALSASADRAVSAVLASAHAVGAAISFDVNHRSKLWGTDQAAPVYRRIAAAADIVFAGADEAELMVGRQGDAEMLAQSVQGLGAREVVIKRGADGAIARSGDKVAVAEAVAVDVVDTVGAGDAFVAGYLAGWLGGDDLRARLDLAVHTGAAACTHAGDWEGAATRSDVERIRRESAGRRVQTIDGEPVDR